MKRIFAILLCLLLLLCGMTACKPDTVSNPAVITDPTDQPPQEQEPSAEEPKDEPLTANPLAAEDFAPSTGVESLLPLSGYLKGTEAADLLAEKTITLYSAGENPAFSYVNQEGVIVEEQQWMKELAKKEGFLLKYHIKPENLSLKTQRIAVYSGKKISLLQLSEKDLAAGLTLARSAKEYLNTKVEPYGISRSVLAKSRQKLFAPVGNVKSLWYNTALTDPAADPLALSQEDQWTLDAFKSTYSFAAKKNVLPLQMSDELAWATLSGKSPLTLLDGKLDSNIHSKASRNVWETLATLRSELPTFKKESNTIYNLKNGNVAMAFTAAPALGKDTKFQYAPLPSLEEGTKGTVVFTGVFLALPAIDMEKEETLAALAFAEAWCNRFTEARAATLQTLGVQGKDYEDYVNLCENRGVLILRDPEIDKTIKPYLNALNKPDADMEKIYQNNVRDPLMALIERFNLYY